MGEDLGMYRDTWDVRHTVCGIQGSMGEGCNRILGTSDTQCVAYRGVWVRGVIGYLGHPVQSRKLHIQNNVGQVVAKLDMNGPHRTLDVSCNVASHNKES